MSTEKRKIGSYFVSKEKSTGKNKDTANTFNLRQFKDFVKYIAELPVKEKIFDFPSRNKVIEVAGIEVINKDGVDLLKGMLLSGKYNHSPDYIARTDGTQTPTNKRMDDAYAEKSHFMGTFSEDGIDLLFEDRRSAAGIGGLIMCLNFLLKKYKHTDVSYFYYDVIAVDDPISVIKSMKRIRLGSLYVDKQILGSEGLNLSHQNNIEDLKEDVILSLGAKRNRTITKDNAINMIRLVASEGSKVRRTRIEGVGDKGRILVDTLLSKKFEDISVKLDEKGLVDSYSIFARMEEILGFDE